MAEVSLLIVGTTIKSAGVGGVSIHVERLLDALRLNGYPFDFCDYKQESVWNVIAQIYKHKVIHIHPSNPVYRLFLVLWSKIFQRKVIFTIHGNIGRFSPIMNWFDRIAIRLCDVPLVINNNSFEKSIKWNRNTRLTSAYIPPAVKGYIPSYVMDRISLERSEGKQIVSTNASVRSFTNDGNEIYGIDFLVEYFRSRKNFFLCVSDPSTQYSQVYNSCKFENILFVTEPHSFYEVMKLSDLMIRATATDGDSLSVREGLELGIKVIATDCVSRPDGVILFRYGDVGSFAKSLFKNPEYQGKSQERVVEDLICIYKNSL